MPLREPTQAQKSKLVVGLVGEFGFFNLAYAYVCRPNRYLQHGRLSADQAVKSLCGTFITGCSRPTTELPPSHREAPSVATLPLLLSRNSQLPSPITPSCEPTLSQPQQLVSLKGFVYEVLCRSRTSGSALQTALCYLKVVRSNVPELVKKEKNGTGVQGKIHLSSCRTKWPGGRGVARARTRLSYGELHRHVRSC